MTCMCNNQIPQSSGYYTYSLMYKHVAGVVQITFYQHRRCYHVCADESFDGYPQYHRKEILFEDTFPQSRSVDLCKSTLQPDVLKRDSAGYVCAEYLKTSNDIEKLSGESKKDARMREMFRLNTDWIILEFGPFSGETAAATRQDDDIILMIMAIMDLIREGGMDL